METRRFKTIRGNIDLYVFLVLLSSMFHIRYQPLSDLSVYISTSALSYLLVFYIGYKFGCYWGLLSGIISAGVWFLFILICGDYSTFQLIFATYSPGDVFTDIPFSYDVSIQYASIQYVVIFGLIGYYSGYLINKIEAFLNRHDLLLEDLLPWGKLLFIESIGDWLKRLVKALYLLQLDPDDKKGVALRRIRKLFVIIITLPLVFLFNILSMNLYIQNNALLTMNIIPVALAPVIGLWIAYVYGPRPGVLISLSLILTPLSGKLLQLFFSEYMDLNPLDYRNSISSPDRVFAIATIAWIIGKVSNRLKEKNISDKLSLSIDPEVNQAWQRVKLWQICLLVVLSLKLTYWYESFSIHWNSIGFLIIYIAWLSIRFTPRQVSNIVLSLFIILAIINIKIPLGTDILCLEIGNFSINEVVMLVMIPIFVSRIKMHSLSQARALMLWILGISWVIYMVFSYGSYAYFPDFFISVRVHRITILPVTIMGVFALFELGARILWPSMNEKTNAVV